MRMNRDQHGNNNDKASAQIMDHTSTAPVGDDRKPPPVAQHRPSGPTKSLSSPGGDDLKSPAKRKRRSPEKPWKKPKDMPKRPLSAYNLFFRDERERLLSSGPGGDTTTEGSDATAPLKGKGKRSKKTSGIGFANLAKTIAAKWKDLDDEVKAPYEKIAAAEKKVYDEAVGEWRMKEKAKKKALAAEKKAAEESRMVATMREAHIGPNLFSSERSLGSFSDSSNPYPSEWFHTTHEEGDVSERSGAGRGPIPPIVDASPVAGDRRRYEAASAWGSQARQDAYYHQRYGTSEDPVQYNHRYAQHQHSAQPQQQHDYSRGGYSLQPHLFSYDTSTQAQHQAYREYYYRDYYNQQPQGADHTSTVHYQQPRLHGDMRTSRDAEQQQLTAHDYTDTRSSEIDAYHAQHAHPQHPLHPQHHHRRYHHHSRGRSASMPLTQGVSERGDERGMDESFRSEPGGYARAAAVGETSRQQRPFAVEAPPINPVESEVDPVDDAFPPLPLDEEDISYITSGMKYS